VHVRTRHDTDTTAITPVIRYQGGTDKRICQRHEKQQMLPTTITIYNYIKIVYKVSTVQIIEPEHTKMIIK